VAQRHRDNTIASALDEFSDLSHAARWWDIVPTATGTLISLAGYICQALTVWAAESRWKQPHSTPPLLALLEGISLCLAGCRLKIGPRQRTRGGRLRQTFRQPPSVIYSSATVYVGGSNVTTSNGLEIPASTPTRLPSSGAEDDVLYGIAASSTATVGYLTITQTCCRPRGVTRLHRAAATPLTCCCRRCFCPDVGGDNAPKPLGELNNGRFIR
jgi:hypothetical protein